MFILARAYAVLDAIALEVHYAVEDAETGKLVPNCLLSQLTVPKGHGLDVHDLAEELGKALQEWVWMERGI